VREDRCDELVMEETKGQRLVEQLQSYSQDNG
jgi:hypothetical protein